MSQNIKQSLIKPFQDHRVIFWYDEKKDFAEEFDMLEISGVDKIHVNQNEFEGGFVLIIFQTFFNRIALPSES
jgi:hypothetical protein